MKQRRWNFLPSFWITATRGRELAFCFPAAAASRVSMENRNAAIKAKYGLDVVGTLTDEKPHIPAKLALESGEDLYDLIICASDQHHPFAIQGYLVDMSSLKYVNLEKDCWNQYANTQLTMGGKLYYTTNKFLLQDKHRSWMVWYNRTMAQEINLGYLEQEVFDGTWTMDRLIEDEQEPVLKE